MSGGILDGVRVVEAAIYGFVPGAGAVLCDWGADVIKLERPDVGDPLRGLAAYGIPPETNGVSPLWESFNRGKRSVGINLLSESAREVVYRLVDSADVFITNFLPRARKGLGIDAPELIERNPRLIYGRGSGYGPSGEAAEKGGFDALAYWGRTGAAVAVTPHDDESPRVMPGTAYGDSQAGAELAGGIAAALYARERTGRGSVVDVSLLGAGLWAMQASAVACAWAGRDHLVRYDRRQVNNPLANTTYRTSDGRYVALAMLESDRYWPGLLKVIGSDELADDSRFGTAELRRVNAGECVDVLDSVFGQRTLVQWQDALSRQEGQWEVIQTPDAALRDPQAIANGYVQVVPHPSGAHVPLVASPVQFGQHAPALAAAPALGAHTEEVLLELGYTWDELLELKGRDAIT
jgi:crotonobetainyl-CoA:carnitine CoA-transferase CaiB-like acyl-CoA transferase